MQSGNEDKASDFTIIKRAVQRIAQATGAAVGLIHHTGWDDSRERGSSRQRQALDVVMQIKDQRITNIKQKFGPKFEPIMFTVEEAPGTGSIFARLSTEAEQLRQAFESVNTVSSEINAVKALAIMLGNPGISGNKIVEQLHIQKSSWGQLRASLRRGTTSSARAATKALWSACRSPNTEPTGWRRSKQRRREAVPRTTENRFGTGDRPVPATGSGRWSI